MDTEDFGHEDQVDDEDEEGDETNFSKSINMNTDEVGHQEYKSINMDSNDITTDADIKDNVSASTLDIFLRQAYEEIFGDDDDVPNMVVPPTTDLFQQPFYLQSSEYEINFTPPLDIQLHQAYEAIFDDPGVSTMLSTSDEGLFHQPFYLQPDEYEIDFANIQDHKPIANENGKHQSCLLSLDAIGDSAFPHFSICHDLVEIQPIKHGVINDCQVDGETHLGPDGEIHLVKDMINQINGDMISQVDGGTHIYNDGETHLHKIDHKASHCLGHDIGIENFSNVVQLISYSGCESVKITSSSASNDDPSFLDHLLRDRSTSAFSKTGYAHGKGIHSLFTMINILIWLWGATRVKKKKKHRSKSLFLFLYHKKPPDPISYDSMDHSPNCTFHRFLFGERLDLPYH
ncbi:hypothetical protein ACA910_006848 [Epithemia clementina (nom. ined.)]